MASSLAELAELVGGSVTGDGQLPITGAATLSAARAGDITLLDSSEKLARLAHSGASAVVAPHSLEQHLLPAIRVDDVRAAFAKIVCNFRPQRQSQRVGVSPQAFVSASAKLGPNVDIHPGASVGDEVIIGAGSTIHSG